MELWIWAVVFFGFGMFALGVYSEGIEGSDETWGRMATIAIAVSVVLAIIAANPAEKMKANADKIRSQYTTDGALK